MFFRFKLVLSKTNILILSYIILFLFLNIFNIQYIDVNYILNNNLFIYYPFLFIQMFLHTTLWQLYIDCYFIYTLGNFLENMYSSKKTIFIYILIGLLTNVILICFYHFTGNNIVYNYISGYLGYGLIGFILGKIILTNMSIYRNVLLSSLINIMFFILLSYLVGISIFSLYSIVSIVSGLVTSLVITN